MESEDVFGGNEIAPEDDPFAGTDFGDFDGGEPAAAPPAEERPAPTADLPVVDKEGQRVETQAADKGAAPLLTDEQAKAEAARYREEHGEPDPKPATEGSPSSPTTASPTEPPSSETAAAESSASSPGAEQPDPEVVAPPTPQGATPDAPPAETPLEPTPEPAPDPTPRGESAGPTEAAEPESSPEPEVAEGDAPAPQEKKDKTGRTTHRRYLLLKPDGNGKYTEIVWYENSKGEMVDKNSRGSKRQKYALARGQEEALRIGYAALGAPPKATIVAVALSAFQSRTVEPDVPQPTAVRLKIR